MTRLLVVDDDENVREVLVDSLVKAGYDVAEASEGETALRRGGAGVLLRGAEMYA